MEFMIEKPPAWGFQHASPTVEPSTGPISEGAERRSGYPISLAAALVAGLGLAVILTRWGRSGR